MQSMKKNKKKMSLHIWKYFTVFSIIIMVTLWVLQIILFSTYYETMKIKELTSIGNEVLSDYGNENFEENTERIAFVQGVSIGVFDEDINIIHYTDTYNFKGDSLGPKRFDGGFKRPEATDGYIKDRNEDGGKKSDEVFEGHMEIKKVDARRVLELFENTKGNSVKHTEKHRRFGKMITYAVRKNVDSGYVYVYVRAALPPSNYTIDILRTQLIMVTILSLAVAFILSYFFSKRLTRPIENITRSAEQLAEGNYNTKFEESEYFELNRLSNVLNFATKEIEKTENMRNDLMANVSHDLRTPLTIIRSYAEMIRDLSGDNPKKREQHTNVIIKEADRLSNLVTDMLDLTKFDAGIHHKDIKSVCISDMVESIMASFQIVSETDGYTIETDIRPDLKVLADERMINQAVYNLVSNAINYTGEDKKISVSVFDTEDGKVRFQVKDTGKGIDDKEKEFVWDRYYKSSKTHTREVKGSGLGLSIVKNILKVHNAEYGVESKVGEGSVFWFELNMDNPERR